MAILSDITDFIDSPKIFISPLLGFISLPIIFNKVVLPQPDGPMIVIKSPFYTFKETFLNT